MMWKEGMREGKQERERNNTIKEAEKKYGKDEGKEVRRKKGNGKRENEAELNIVK